MTFVCLGIAKLECQISLGISFLSLICLCIICLKEKYEKKNQKQKDKKKIENSEKYKNSVCFVYIGTCVPWMAIETKFSKLCIIL